MAFGRFSSQRAFDVILLAKAEKGRQLFGSAVLIRTDVNNKFGIRTGILHQFALDLVKLHFHTFDRVRSLSGNLHCPNVFFMNRSVRLAIDFGQMKVDTLFEQWGGDDEDDQQHECEVEERRDVDIAQRDQGIAL